MGSDLQTRSSPSVRTESTISAVRCVTAGVAAAIAAVYPEFTWECSHLGGDRFAATMLVLPEGLCYGRVDSTDAANLIHLYLGGRLDNAYLPGRTSLSHAVQAAQHYARQASGDDRIEAFAPLDVESGDGTTRVVLQLDAGSLDITVADRMSDPLLSQCQARAAGRVRMFELVSMSRG